MPQNFEREYFRAPADILVYYCPENPENRRLMSMEWGAAEHQMDLEANSRLDFHDPESKELYGPLMPVLRWLDFKLDLILLQVRLQSRPNLFTSFIRTADISGSGCGVTNGEELIPGQRLLLALSLPDAPARLLYAVGQVVRSHDQEGTGAAGQEDAQPHSAIHFVEIEESDRERIMRFAQSQQRKMLGSKE